MHRTCPLSGVKQTYHDVDYRFKVGIGDRNTL
jgi:hypothetical protein